MFAFRPAPGLAGVLAVLCLATGCSHWVAATQPAGDVRGLSEPSANEDVRALVAVPAGWQARPLKVGDRSWHQTWVSPSEATAFGVIFVKLPLPVGPELSLLGFLSEMRKEQGEARLLAKQFDESIDGLRFVAEGPDFTIHGNLITRGFSCWVAYAGTITGTVPVADELALAEKAREAVVPRR
jgi:hypothetical protein